MKRRQRAALHTIAAVVLHSVCIAVAHAEPVAAAAIEEQASRQARIYASRGANVPEGYVLDRSLLSVHSHSAERVQAHTREAHPAGPMARHRSGRGPRDPRLWHREVPIFVFEGLERGGEKARAVAISIEDRRTPRWHQTGESLAHKQIDYLFGKRLRDYSVAELGRFQLITDVMGGFSYTRDLAVFMEKTLGFLEPNGMFFTVLQDVRSEAGTNRPHYPGAVFLTELAARDGSELKVCSWLKSIGCVEVTCEARPQTAPPIEVYGIRKVCERVTVPALELVHFEAGTPPERRFKTVR